MKNRLMLFAVLVVIVAAPAGAQTLGDAAKREADRRAKVAPAKVYTADDLKDPSIQRAVAGAKPAAPAAQPETTAPAAAAAAKPDDKTAKPAAAEEKPAPAATVRVKRDEEHWRERAKVIRTRLDRLRSDSMAVEERVTTLQAQLQSVSALERGAVASELDQAAQALARFQKDLRLIEDEWRTFEDRARAAKVPPAWIY